jgi:hypothetical protein
MSEILFRHSRLKKGSAPFMTSLIWLQSPATTQEVLLKLLMYMATTAPPTAVAALMPSAFLKFAHVGFVWGVSPPLLVSCNTVIGFINSEFGDKVRQPR